MILPQVSQVQHLHPFPSLLPNNSHEEHLDCDHYSLCWGIWKFLRLYFLKDSVSSLSDQHFFGIYPSFNCCYFSAWKWNSSKPLDFNTASITAPAAGNQHGPRQWRKEGLKLTWPFFSSLPLGRHVKAGRNSNVPFNLLYLGLVHAG